MDPVTHVRNSVMTIPPGSPPYELAVAICQMRNLNPDYPAMGTGFQNWQAVIAETLLLNELNKLFPEP